MSEIQKHILSRISEAELKAAAKHIQLEASSSKLTADIKIPYDLPAVLCRTRELRNKYETNQQIKTFSAFYILKSLTTSSIIKEWIKQTDHLANVLQVSPRTLRTRIKEMQLLKLCTLTRGDLILASYEDAANQLGVSKHKYITVHLHETTPLHYALQAVEIQQAKQRQLDGLIYYISKNPILRNGIEIELMRYGANQDKLKIPEYFQEQLLRLQKLSFREGSEIYVILFERRADINRCIKTIAKEHNYKGLSSISYHKKNLEKKGLIENDKPTPIVSKVRSRIYYSPSGDGGDKVQVNTYCKPTRQTIWNLPDNLINKVRYTEAAA